MAKDEAAETLSNERRHHAQRRRELHRKDEEHERTWSGDTLLRDLRKVSRRATAEIEADPQEAAALDRARRQARDGKLISQEELDREFESDE